MYPAGTVRLHAYTVQLIDRRDAVPIILLVYRSGNLQEPFLLFPDLSLYSTVELCELNFLGPRWSWTRPHRSVSRATAHAEANSASLQALPHGET